MGSLEKYTSDQVAMIYGHNGRTHNEYGNKDIDKSRTHLNYKLSPERFIKDEKTGIPVKISDYEYFQRRTGELYLYGRGSKREKDAVTAAGWVTTCPKELVGCPEKEESFFKAVYQFYEDRYGRENVISCYIHYDEGGSPHMHFLFIPVTELDPDKVHFKTRKTKSVVKTDSGRREFASKFILDKEGNKIPLKNYARMADYYTEKIAGADVLNQAELKSIHYDMQAYLKAHHIEGQVLNGSTGSANVSVKELKRFTENTGLRISDVSGIDKSKSLLENFYDQQQKAVSIEAALTEKNERIARLEETIAAQAEKIEKAAAIEHDNTKRIAEYERNNQELAAKVETLEKDLSNTKEELCKAHDMIYTISSEKTVRQEEQAVDKDDIWGNNSRNQDQENNKTREKVVENNVDMLW